MSILDTLRYVGAWLRARADFRDESGAALVEYGLLVALLAVIVMATLQALGFQVRAMFCSVLTQLGGSC